MDYNRLSSKSKKSWFISRLIATIVVGLVLGGVIWYFNYHIKFKYTMMFKSEINLVCSLILIFLSINTLVYPYIEYKQWRYLINEDKVDFSEGIFSTKRTIIPIIRIQHIVIKEGILNRMFSLANVEIYTAGGIHTIPNLDIESAKEIGEYLKAKINKKVDVDDVRVN